MYIRTFEYFTGLSILHLMTSDSPFCKILQVWPSYIGLTVILQIQDRLGHHHAILHTHGSLYTNKWQGTTTYHIRTISWLLIMFLKPKSCTYSVTNGIASLNSRSTCAQSTVCGNWWNVADYYKITPKRNIWKCE